MNQPRTLEVPLTVHGYKLKLDTDRCDCMEWKYPHWHLWNRDRKIGTITAEGVWKEISPFATKSSNSPTFTPIAFAKTTTTI